MAHPRGAETGNGGRRGVTVLGVAVAGAIACVGARSPSRGPAPETPPIALPGVTVQLLPAVGDARDLRIVERDGAVRRVLAGAVRAEVGPVGAALADERFATPILTAMRTGSGWLFFSSDLVVARADTFLGARSARCRSASLTSGRARSAYRRRAAAGSCSRSTIPTPACGSPMASRPCCPAGSSAC